MAVTDLFKQMPYFFNREASGCERKHIARNIRRFRFGIFEKISSNRWTMYLVCQEAFLP